MKRLWPCYIVLVAPLTLSGLSHAGDSEETPEKAIDEARAMLAADHVRPALAILKTAAKKWPNNEIVVTELAAAYVAETNDFWALKVLRNFQTSHPPACAARAWIATIYIRQANLELAEETLASDDCQNLPQDRARNHLLHARLSILRNNNDVAAEHLEKARTQSALYDEDSGLLRTMDQRIFPGRLPWASWRADLGLGFTSNGLAGSPVDRENPNNTRSSTVLSFDSRLRVLWLETGAIRPTTELSLRSLLLGGNMARDLSYVAPGIRPGLLLGTDYPRLLLAYSFDALRLAAADRYAGKPVWYAEGHRFEYEIEASQSLVAFGGAGRRLFREQGRSRWEFDQGIAFGAPVNKRLRLLTGLSMHWNQAENDAYDSIGATTIAQLQSSLPFRLEGRVSGSFSHEAFPRSRGYFAGTVSENRGDNVFRVKTGLWSPVWQGLRFGLDYEFAKRASTADAYRYDDHRALLHATWTLDTDRLGVKSLGPNGRTPLPHGTGSAAGLSNDLQIRDLMRQDEAVKQGSSCLK